MNRKLVVFLLILLLGLGGSTSIAGAASTIPNPTSMPLADWAYAWEEQADLDPDAALTPPDTGWQPAGRLMDLPGRDGRRVLWLRAVLPELRYQDAALLVQASELFEVYINEERVYRHGNLSPGQTPVYHGMPNRVVSLPAEASGQLVYFRIYSDRSEIGMLATPLVSSRGELWLNLIRAQAVRFVLGAFFTLIGLLSIYPFMRLRRQGHLACFACFALFFGLYTASRTAIAYAIYDAPFVWMLVELGSLMLSLGFVIALIGRMFGCGRWSYIKRLWQTHLGFACITVPLIALQVVQADQVLQVYQAVILLSMVLGIHRVAHQAVKGDPDARLVCLGLGVFCLLGAFDIIRQLADLTSPFPDLAYWGALIFLVTLMAAILRKLVLMRIRLSNTEKLSVAGQLAAGVAHEIRNPLTVLSGYVQLLSKQGGSNSEVLEIMGTEIDRIEHIMKEFLVLAKPAAPKLERHRLEAIVRDVLPLFHQQTEVASIKLILRSEPELQPILCDGNQLKQVLINVIKNALEAMGEQGGELSIAVSALAHDQFIRISDTGCGLAGPELERIGQPFYTTKENGTGLGVMICRSIMDYHKGSFTINSVAGEGTTVTLRLPARG